MRTISTVLTSMRSGPGQRLGGEKEDENGGNGVEDDIGGVKECRVELSPGIVPAKRQCGQWPEGLVAGGGGEGLTPEIMDEDVSPGVIRVEILVSLHRKEVIKGEVRPKRAQVRDNGGQEDAEEEQVQLLARTGNILHHLRESKKKSMKKKKKRRRRNWRSRDRGWESARNSIRNRRRESSKNSIRNRGRG